MAKYPARKARVYMGTAAGALASAITGLSDVALDMTTDTIEVTAFGDTNKTYVQGLPDLKGTFSGFWDETGTDNLFAAAASVGAVNMYVYPSLDAVSKFWEGTAWVSASLNAAVAAAVKVSGSFMAATGWTKH